MEQPRKGKQWHCGMKLHLGVDDQTGLVHSLGDHRCHRP
ncbi:MAG: transposase [Synechococcus sp. SB0675_bin_7]|nr:transposase [Synechococcus sp. SB0675_bin_7]